MEFIGFAGFNSSPFQNLITFGDSSVDVGNVFLSTNQTQPPSPPYFKGRSSNGPVFVERIAEELELSASTPSLVGGDNYAFGGAEFGDGTSEQGTPNIGNQIDVYLNSNTPTEKDLLFISGGSNNFLTLDSVPDPAETVNLVVDHITTLANAGGENFAVTNLPPLGNTPFIPNQGGTEVVNLLISNYNNLLDQELDDLEIELDIEIYEIDLEETIQEIFNDPADSSLTNVTDPALNEETLEVVENPNEFLFWDNVHPTATVGEIVAETALEVILEGTVSEAPRLRFGSLDNDVVEITGGNEIIFTGKGDDIVDASTGTGGNRIYGGTDNDELLAGQKDRLFGGEGDDILDASVGAGGNRLYGGAGQDDFFAGSNDRLVGGEGSDRVFILNGGDNLITGGADADQFWIANAQLPASANTVTDFTIDEDVLGIGGIDSITEFADLTLTQEGSDTIISSSHNELVRLVGISKSELTADQFVIEDNGPVF